MWELKFSKHKHQFSWCFYLDFAKHCNTYSIDFCVCYVSTCICVVKWSQSLIFHCKRTWFYFPYPCISFSGWDSSTSESSVSERIVLITGLTLIIAFVKQMSKRQNSFFCFYNDWLDYSKALDLHLSVAILRLKEGLDYSRIITDEVAIVTTEVEATAATSFLSQLNSQETLPRNESFISTMSQG